jgi:hypothetical protein
MKAKRNDPCPCGSGKKYKKCHGAIEQESQKIQRTISVDGSGKNTMASFAQKIITVMESKTDATTQSFFSKSKA